MKQIGHVTLKSGETLAVTKLDGDFFNAVKANPDSGLARKNGKEHTYQVDSIKEVIFLQGKFCEWNAPWITDGSFNKSKYDMDEVLEDAKKFMKYMG